MIFLGMANCGLCKLDRSVVRVISSSSDIGILYDSTWKHFFLFHKMILPLMLPFLYLMLLVQFCSTELLTQKVCI